MDELKTVRFKASENYILRDITGKRVLIAIGAGIADFNGYIQLNDTAAFLWKQLKEPCTCEELVSALTKEYPISQEQATVDVEDFLHELSEQKMVTIHE